ncbi:succinate dehydrogenase, cytochrome b556 subunit [Dichotomicrobium thermohalophilum]|uniref:Succinate dehydrogenase cytochrome b556 subunit n=1 Tax=Dichotomicrobium thermohalophilum TaxID=933063 RepID=A0A397P8F2_9HYPH|nr:succinate dehydrogenase, cytochrome b556 subunit [Dichotomicrobium thermohalophilum]RIA45372.1 succinate dehydrogenase subunit C [Dichotomicrobium thermohalophilum]
MRSSPRRHRSYWAFIGHRISGIALALFLPLHFLVLGLALEGAAELNRFLVLADTPLFKVAEWGLVVLLTIHLFFGLRLLALELLPWRDGAREGWITAGIGAAVVAGGAFLLGAF